MTVLLPLCLCPVVSVPYCFHTLCWSIQGTVWNGEVRYLPTQDNGKLVSNSCCTFKFPLPDKCSHFIFSFLYINKSQSHLSGWRLQNLTKLSFSSLAKYYSASILHTFVLWWFWWMRGNKTSRCFQCDALFTFFSLHQTLSCEDEGLGMQWKIQNTKCSAAYF